MGTHLRVLSFPMNTNMTILCPYGLDESIASALKGFLQKMSSEPVLPILKTTYIARKLGN